MTTFADKIASAKKALIGVASIVSALLALGLIPTPYDKYAAAALGILGSYGIYAIKNKLTPAQLLAQPNYVPSASHVPMPVGTPVPAIEGHQNVNSAHVEGSYVDPAYAAELEERAKAAKPKHDPTTGRFTR